MADVGYSDSLQRPMEACSVGVQAWYKQGPRGTRIWTSKEKLAVAKLPVSEHLV